MCELVHFNGQRNPENAAPAPVDKRCKALTESAGTGEEIDHWNGGCRWHEYERVPFPIRVRPVLWPPLNDRPVRDTQLLPSIATPSRIGRVETGGCCDLATGVIPPSYGPKAMAVHHSVPCQTG